MMKNSYKGDIIEKKLQDDIKSRLDTAAKINTLEEYQQGLYKIEYRDKKQISGYQWGGEGIVGRDC